MPQFKPQRYLKQQTNKNYFTFIKKYFFIFTWKEKLLVTMNVSYLLVSLMFI